MITLYKPTTIEDFESLKKGDMIIVKWHSNFLLHHSNAKELMSYRVHEANHVRQEITCQINGNHYFNYEMLLKGESLALEVAFIKDGEPVEK